MQLTSWKVDVLHRLYDDLGLVQQSHLGNETDREHDTQ